MPRIALSRYVMVTLFIAIILAFTQSEGCGTRHAMIEAISFTSDQSLVVATTLNARDARTPMKHYLANLSRTRSWINVSDGSIRGVIHQDFKAGNSGPAFRLFYVGRTSVLCNPSNDHVAMSAFGGGDITRNVGTENPVDIPLQHPACNITYSGTGRYLAASGSYELTVLDTKYDTVTMHVQADDLPFLSASLMSFADDETGIVVASDSGVHLWDMATSVRVSTVVQGFEPWINAIAVAPSDNVIVCSNGWVRRYDFTGQVVATLANKRGHLCAVATHGSRLAVSGNGELTIYDLNSNKALRSLWFHGATALALSSSGNVLAVGDDHGRVSLFDVATGAKQWQSNPPGRYRLPWTMPATFLVAWIYVAWRFTWRQKIVASTEVEIGDG
jgi:WD40 repeat protein